MKIQSLTKELEKRSQEKQEREERKIKRSNSQKQSQSQSQRRKRKSEKFLADTIEEENEKSSDKIQEIEYKKTRLDNLP